MRYEVYAVHVLDRWAYLEPTVELIEAGRLVPRYLATGSGITTPGISIVDALARHWLEWIREKSEERDCGGPR